MIRLGNICEKIGSGATPRGGKETYCTIGTALVRSQNVLDFNFSCDGLVYINETQASKLSNVEVQEEDVLLNITGDSVARACMMDSDFLPARVNQHVAIIRGKKDVVLNSFLLYFLQWRKEYLLQLASAGATRNALTKGMIEKLEIDLPPVEEQEKIVAVLAPLQKKIELNQRINENLEQQSRAVFSKMFLNNSAIVSTPGVLSDIATITMGQSPNGNSYNENGTGEVFYQGRAEFGFRFPTRRLFTTEPKQMAQKGDILLSVRAPVGDINVACERCCIGRGLSAIHSKDGNSSFLLYTIFSLKSQLDVFNSEGTVFGSIKRDMLNSMQISIPSSEAIAKFERIVHPMDDLICENYEETRRLQTIRDGLLPKLISGEIDVTSILL